MAPAFAGIFRRKNYFRAARASSNCVHELEEPRVKHSTFASRAISVYGPKMWNMLPPYLRNFNDYKTFKSHLKTF